MGEPSGEDDFTYTHPEADKNWIYSRTFSEDNRVNENVVYANGLQHIAQQQTRLQDDNQIVATQTYQDYIGRNTISTLPIPAQGKSDIKYIPGLLKNTSTSVGYQTSDFDTDPKNPAAATDFGGYYSEGSTNTINQGVANAQGYPFSQTLYAPDGTNQVREQTGVGYTHSVKGGKTLRTFYSQPTEFELLRLFGKETPDVRSVQKVTTYDANGSVRISYQIKDGKVIATAVAITSAGGALSDLPSKASGTTTFKDEMKGNERIDERTVVSRKPLFFEMDRSVTVDYEITPAQLQELCNSGTTNDLVGYYPFDGKTDDLSLTANSAELLGGTSLVAGASGSAYRLDGNTGTYIQMADVAATDFGINDFTVSFWVKKNANTSAWDNSAGLGKWNSASAPGTNEWYFSLATTATNNIPKFSVEINNTTYTVNGTTNMAASQWYHLTAKRQGTSLKIYVNGALQGTLAVPGAAITSTSLPLLVGVSSTYYTAADFDDLKIYKRGLSDAEISSLFTQGTICKTCDYKIDIVLYREGDNVATPVGSNTITAGNCSQQSALKWDPAAFAPITLTGGINYTLEKRITIGNTNTATSQPFVEEHAAAVGTYYRGQADTRLAPIYTYLNTNNTAGLYTYLAGQGFQYDTENQQYIVPLLPTGAGGCQEFLFIPYLEPCPPEPGAPDPVTCKVDGKTFEQYFTAYYAGDPDVTPLLPDGKLSYVFYKNLSVIPAVNVHFAAGKLDQMITNMMADNQLACVLVWNAWKDVVAAYKSKLDAPLEGSPTEAGYPFATTENNLLLDFFAAIETRLQDNIITDHSLDPAEDFADICLQRPSTSPALSYFIGKSVLYGTIGGATTRLPNAITTTTTNRS